MKYIAIGCVTLTLLEHLVENLLDFVRVELAVVARQVLERLVALVRLRHVIVRLVADLLSL